MNIQHLQTIAKQIRTDIVNMIYTAGSGHIGGALSAVELMVALYFDQLRHNPKNPDWECRDRVVFSKGHASALLYACLAETGYFPKADLWTFRKLGSLLQGHPARNGLPGVELSTGSLGQGLSAGLGMAMVLPVSQKVFVLLGDGECDCGQVWEAAMAASHYKASNLCAIVDWNGLQIDGTNEQVMSLHPFANKWLDFGWAVRTIDGHDLERIVHAYSTFIDLDKTQDRPMVILAHTIKGKGIPFMENQACWHGKSLNKEQWETALGAL